MQPNPPALQSLNLQMLPISSSLDQGCPTRRREGGEAEHCKARDPEHTASGHTPVVGLASG